MLKKEFIVRNFDASYFNDLSNGGGDQEFGDHLTNEYGTHGFEICHINPIFDENNVLIAYKIIFVKDLEDE